MGWFLARLLQESQNRASIIGKTIKPFMMILFWGLILPMNKLKAISSLSPKVSLLDTLYLFYDLDVSPVTYDFSWALVLAEQERKRRNLASVTVVFVPGKKQGLREEDPGYEAEINYFSRLWRRHEMLYAMCHLLPSCAGVTLCQSREQANVLCESARPNLFPKQYNEIFPITHETSQVLQHKTSDIMALRSTLQALKYMDQWLAPRLKQRKLITITLRQSSYMPARNSNISAWAEFARSLNPREFFVVFIADTDSALEGIPAELAEFVFFNEACWNLNLRSALYERSYLNLGVNNGPMALCWLNANCRYITFKLFTPDVPQASLAAYKRHGIDIGKSLPFSTDFQTWAWEEDQLNVITRKFGEIQRIMEVAWK